MLLQLIEDINALFNKDDLPEEHRSALASVIPFTAGQPSKSAFSTSMQERANAIRAVLARFAANGAQANSPELADLQARCHHLVDEARVLRQRASTAEQEVQVTRSDLSEVTEALRRAERKVDRLQSRSVLLSERPSTKAEE